MNTKQIAERLRALGTEPTMLLPADKGVAAAAADLLERMAWVPVSERLPDDSIRVETFSPAYATDDPMRFRMMGGQFVRISTEVTHWRYIDPPSE